MSKRKSIVNGPGWRVEWQRFTKEDARKALAKFQDDRPTSEPWVQALTRTMDMGLWNTYSPSQTPIAFDKNGNRLNGKHRLLAFERSKLTELVFPVVLGLDPVEFAHFDQDTKLRQKTAAHRDRSNVARDLARINWLEALSTGDMRAKLTTPVFSALADGKWRKQITWADEVLPSGGSQGRAPYAAALMYVHRVDPAFADKVGRSWANGGSGLPAQVLRLRDHALMQNGSRNGGERASRVGPTFKLLHALALMHEGRHLPERMSENLHGLRYWSEKMRDGAISRWEKGAVVVEG